MRKASLLFSTVALVLLLAGSAFAGDVKKTVPGELTLDQAQTIIKAALAKAEAINVPVNIAVVDSGGNLKGFFRMDDAFIGSIDISIKKAVTARYFNMTTRTLGSVSQVGQPLYGIEASNDGLILFAGGVLLVDKNNVIVGAIGVSGGTVDEDEAVAKVGAAALLK